MYDGDTKLGTLTAQSTAVKTRLSGQITGTGTLTLIGAGSNAVDGTVSIEGTPVTKGKTNGTYDYKNLNLVVSGGGNQWVISKK